MCIGIAYIFMSIVTYDIHIYFYIDVYIMFIFVILKLKIIQ